MARHTPNKHRKKPPKLYGLHHSIEEILEARDNNRLIRLGLGLPGSCNWKCPYCFTEAGQRIKADPIPYERMVEIVHEAKSLGASTVVIDGEGEPLLNKRIFDILKEIKSSGMLSVLFTNASRITPDIAKKLVGLADTVVTKWNTSDKELQEAFSGVKNPYGRYISYHGKDLPKGIKHLIDVGFAGCYKKGDVEVTRLGIESLICWENSDFLQGLFIFCREEGIFPYFEIVKPQGWATGTIVSSERNGKYNYIAAGLVGKKAKEFFEFLSRWDDYSWPVVPPVVASNCFLNMHTVNVSNGYVYPCPGIERAIGDVRKHSLKQVLDQSQFLKVIRHLEEYIQEPCRSCYHFNNYECYGGCRGFAYLNATLPKRFGYQLLIRPNKTVVLPFDDITDINAITTPDPGCWRVSCG